MFTGDDPESRLPLARYEVFHSCDRDHVRDVMSRAFKPHSLDVLGADARLDARMRSARLGDMSVSLVTYGGDVRIGTGPLETFFVLLIPLTGRTEIRSRGERYTVGAGTAYVLSPGDPVTVRWPSDCTQLVVRLERWSTEACLADLLGAPLRRPLRFAPVMDVRSGYGRTWCRVLELLLSELDRTGSLVEQSTVADRLVGTLTTALLLAHKHNYTKMLDGEMSVVPSRAVSIALEWIESHPQWLHTTASLAREADVTERSLQQGFRRHLNMAPMEYLREVRLRRIRDRLHAAQADAVTVTEVAAEWGFQHTGHFAARYQRRFGERPSETLRKSSRKRIVRN